MGGGGKSSQSTQTVSIPPEVLARYNAVNARAENVAQQPFQQYGGEFVAPLTPTQTAGIEATSKASQLAQPYYGAATGAAIAGAMPVNPQGLQVGQYMNPFTESVVGATQAAMGQQQGQQLAQQQAEAIRAGAYGGDRAGLQRQALRGQQSLAQAQAIAPLYQQNYQQALQTAQQQQGVGLGAQQANRQAVQQLSQQLGGLGTGAQQAALQGAQAQIGAGTLQQQTQQAQDTAQYQQFLQQRGYDFQVAQFLANIAMGTGALSGSTTTSTQPRGFFSNRGGFKTGESLQRSGKAYGGGLDPNSMGGAVYEPGAFERGGYATSGAVVDSNDLAAILAQQRQSFGPFAAAGPYGQAAGATPHGPGGIVPQQQMHTPKLVTAGPLPKQQAGAGSDLGKVYSLADEATKGLSGKGLTERAGEKMGLRDSAEKIAEAKGDIAPAGVTGKSGAAPMPMSRPDASELPSGGGFGDWVSGLFKAEGGGVMPRHRYADGGGEDSQADEAIPHDPSDVMSGKDPIEGVLKAGSQKHEMLKPAGGGGGGGGSGKLGLGKLAGSAIGSAFGPLGSMAGGFLGGLLPFNEGGVVPRQHHAGGERVNSDVPADYSLEADLPSPRAQEAGLVVPRQEEERPRYKIAPMNWEDMPEHRHPLIKEIYQGEGGNRYNIRQGGQETFDTSGPHPGPKPPRGGESSAAGNGQFLYGTWNDVTGGAPMDKGYQDAATWTLADRDYRKRTGRDLDTDLKEKGMTPEIRSVLSPTWTSFAKQGLGGARPQTTASSGESGGLGAAKELGFFDRNKGIILPVLQGLGAMASSKSISPWAAALQGLGAGAKAYGDVEKQQAEIQESKARAIEGLSRVGPVIGQFDAMGRPIYDVKAEQFAGPSLKPKTPLQTEQEKQRKKAEEAVNKPASLTDLASTTPRGSAADIARQEHSAIYRSMSPETDIAENRKILKDARDSMESSRTAKNQINNLALPITGLAAGQVIEPGALAPVLGNLLTKFNGVLQQAGIPPIAPGTMSQVALADKMQAIMASEATKNLGMHARGVLEDVTKAFATKAMDKDAAATLLASTYMDNYKNEHKNSFIVNYGDPSLTGLQNPVAKNASSAYRAQHPEYELENQFLKDKALVKDFLLLPELKRADGTPTGEHLLAYLMGEGKDKEIAKKYTPEVIQKLLKEKYGTDVTKYLKN